MAEKRPGRILAVRRELAGGGHVVVTAGGQVTTRGAGGELISRRRTTRKVTREFITESEKARLQAAEANRQLAAINLQREKKFRSEVAAEERQRQLAEVERQRLLRGGPALQQPSPTRPPSFLDVTPRETVRDISTSITGVLEKTAGVPGMERQRGRLRFIRKGFGFAERGLAGAEKLPFAGPLFAPTLKKVGFTGAVALAPIAIPKIAAVKVTLPIVGKTAVGKFGLFIGGAKALEKTTGVGTKIEKFGERQLTEAKLLPEGPRAFGKALLGTTAKVAAFPIRRPVVTSAFIISGQVPAAATAGRAALLGIAGVKGVVKPIFGVKGGIQIPFTETKILEKTTFSVGAGEAIPFIALAEVPRLGGRRIRIPRARRAPGAPRQKIFVPKPPVSAAERLVQIRTRFPTAKSLAKAPAPIKKELAQILAGTFKPVKPTTFTTRLLTKLRLGKKGQVALTPRPKPKITPLAKAPRDIVLFRPVPRRFIPFDFPIAPRDTGLAVRPTRAVIPSIKRLPAIPPTKALAPIPKTPLVPVPKFPVGPPRKGARPPAVFKPPKPPAVIKPAQPPTIFRPPPTPPRIIPRPPFGFRIPDIPTPGLPLFFLPTPLPGGGGGGGGFSFKRRIRRATKFQPSLFAITRKIFGPAPGVLTGLGIRPIPGMAPKKKKKKKKKF